MWYWCCKYDRCRRLWSVVKQFKRTAETEERNQKRENRSHAVKSVWETLCASGFKVREVGLSNLFRAHIILSESPDARHGLQDFSSSTPIPAIAVLLYLIYSWYAPISFFWRWSIYSVWFFIEGIELKNLQRVTVKRLPSLRRGSGHWAFKQCWYC